MTFDAWWNKKAPTFQGPVSKAHAKSIAYEAWVLAMEGGQIDDVSTDVVVSDICGNCQHPAEFHLPKNDKSQTPCMDTHCACVDLL